MFYTLRCSIEYLKFAAIVLVYWMLIVDPLCTALSTKVFGLSSLKSSTYASVPALSSVSCPTTLITPKRTTFVDGSLY